MILIADSGSTKTHWHTIGCTEQLDIFTSGINPFYQTEQAIGECVGGELLPALRGAVDAVFFYGAGCHFPDKKRMVQNALAAHFPQAEIEICNDLLAACRALFGQRKGIACILGTGSNSCLYNGKNIVENVSPLGFILGDEGSGAVIGRLLVGNVLKRQLPDEICSLFLEKYNLTAQNVLENVYKRPFPNRFLASLAPFVKEHIDHPAVRQMVRGTFLDFFRRNVMQYSDFQMLPISFVGSVAFFLQDLLAECAAELGLHFESAVRSPMDGLVKFHQNY